MLVARSGDDLEATAESVRTYGVACETVVGDVRDDALAERVAGLTADTLGPPSLLVNHAGIAQLGAMADVTIEDWWDVLDVNLRAPMVWIKAVLPVMREQRRGRIINVSSPASSAPLPWGLVWCVCNGPRTTGGPSAPTGGSTDGAGQDESWDGPPSRGDRC